MKVLRGRYTPICCVCLIMENWLIHIKIELPTWIFYDTWPTCFTTNVGPVVSSKLICDFIRGKIFSLYFKIPSAAVDFGKVKNIRFEY